MTNYAEDPKYIEKINSIKESIKNIQTPEDINKDIDRISEIHKKESPLKGKGELIKNVAEHYEIPIKLFLAILRDETNYGIRNKNINNFGNIKDNKVEVDFDTIEEGIIAAARYLAESKIK